MDQVFSKDSSNKMNFNFLMNKELYNGRRDIGTFRTKGHINMTLLERLSFLNTEGDIVQPLTPNSLKECPDDQWCAPYNLVKLIDNKFDIAKFCAIPEICPVRFLVFLNYLLSFLSWVFCSQLFLIFTTKNI
jgi:hypothetical protein